MDSMDPFQPTVRRSRTQAELLSYCALKPDLIPPWAKVSDYLVVVPYRQRGGHQDPARAPAERGRLCREVYPKQGVCHRVLRYSFVEALDVLAIFTQRWILSGARPPVEIEPFAREDLEAHLGTHRSPFLFRLYEIAPWALRRPSVTNTLRFGSCA